ncbi:MAG: SDR family oxidoreductase [Longimicrobiaceae bacterium]
MRRAKVQEQSQGVGRDPRPGATPARRVQPQEPPGREEELRPRADHGEESYRGSGQLQGLATIITGGDSGIGAAVAIAFAREGADVTICYLAGEERDDAEWVRGWVEEAGRRCLVERCDVGDPAQAERLVERAVGEFGRLDVLVNNAAYQCERDSLGDTPVEQIEKTFRTNILGYIYTARAALPYLGPGGVILNTGSVTALEGNAGLIDYSATKGAIHTFTKSLAMSVAERGIRVNCVAPGPVWTPLIPSTLSPEHVARFGRDTAWGRPAQPAEIAPSYVFFASPGARYYTGEILAPTGKATTR